MSDTSLLRMMDEAQSGPEVQKAIAAITAGKVNAMNTARAALGQEPIVIVR